MCKTIFDATLEADQMFEMFDRNSVNQPFQIMIIALTQEDGDVNNTTLTITKKWIWILEVSDGL